MKCENGIEYRTAECCLNCKHRDSYIGRIDRNVLCTRHKRNQNGRPGWVPERGWCSEYVRTESPAIARGERALLEKMAAAIRGDG